MATNPSWFAEHWGLVTATGAVIGWIAGFLVALWKSKAKIKLLKLQERQLKHEIQVKSCASLIHFRAHQEEVREGRFGVVFSEEQFRAWTRTAGYDQFLNDALDYLVKDGRARRADNPGYWTIDWSNSSSVQT